VVSCLVEFAGRLLDRALCESLLSSFAIPSKFCRSVSQACLSGSEPTSGDVTRYSQPDRVHSKLFFGVTVDTFLLVN
jgi:hypothetical protein